SGRSLSLAREIGTRTATRTCSTTNAALPSTGPPPRSHVPRAALGFAPVPANSRADFRLRLLPVRCGAYWPHDGDDDDRRVAAHGHRDRAAAQHGVARCPGAAGPGAAFGR